MAIPTESLLTLTQWLSPAYPVGAFAYSHGLEHLIDDGTVHNSETLEAWLATTLTHGAGQADASFLAASYEAQGPDALAAIDAEARAFAASRERLLETVTMGEAFAKTTAHVWDQDLPALAYPVAIGAAAKRAGLDLDQTGTLYLHAFVSNLVSAAQRLMPLGQSEAQAIIRRLTPRVLQIWEEAKTQDITMITTATILSDVAAMRHETQEPRIFRT